MQIQLSKVEIEEAIRDYMVKEGFTRPVTSITFTKGRGNNNLLADVSTLEGETGLVTEVAEEEEEVEQVDTVIEEKGHEEPTGDTDVLFAPKS